MAIMLLVSATAGLGAKTMEWVKVGKGGKSFVKASSGEAFVPRGFNYDHDYKGRLLEDYWEAEWPTVQEDFAEMKGLGANVIRIHLQFGCFMDGPDRPNNKALAHLERLVSLAESLNLYLDITGLACYRKEHIPGWYDELSEEERWRAQAAFWEAVAARCAGRPGVFCYDLMNEPVVPSGARKPGEWLGPPFGKVWYFVQYIALHQKERVRTDIASDWIRAMSAAIRKHDRRRLITVGMLPWRADTKGSGAGFEPKKVAPEVDFLCVHIYPTSGKVEEALDTLKGFSVGKPVVIEEIFPLHCSVPEVKQFLRDSEAHSAGWIGFYWGKTPDEYRNSGSISDAVTLAWLELFREKTKHH